MYLILSYFFFYGNISNLSERFQSSLVPIWIYLNQFIESLISYRYPTKEAFVQLKQPLLNTTSFTEFAKRVSYSSLFTVFEPILLQWKIFLKLKQIRFNGKVLTTARLISHRLLCIQSKVQYKEQSTQMLNRCRENDLNNLYSNFQE